MLNQMDAIDRVPVLRPRVKDLDERPAERARCSLGVLAGWRN